MIRARLLEIASKAVFEEEGMPTTDDGRYYHAHADAALLALHDAGYAIVPVEPTEAMLGAAYEGLDGGGTVSLIYRAMINAGKGEG